MLDVLTSWLPSNTVPINGVVTGAMPVPVRVMRARLVVPDTVTVMLALRAFAALGSNVTLSVQLSAGATWPLTDVGLVTVLLAGTG
jgi:hypothetical protein